MARLQKRCLCFGVTSAVIATCNAGSVQSVAHVRVCPAAMLMTIGSGKCRVFSLRGRLCCIEETPYLVDNRIAIAILLRKRKHKQ